MWRMVDADPKSSRRSAARGATRGRVRWSWKGRDPGWLSQPLVTEDGRIVVVSTGPTWKESAIVVLDPEGRLERSIDSGGQGWGLPLILQDGSIVARNGKGLATIPPGGDRFTRVEFPFEFRSLRSTPSGDVLACLGGAAFACLTPDLNVRWKASPEIAGFANEGWVAFDNEGILYIGAAGGWQSEEDDPEHFSGFGALDRDGRELWKVNLGGSSAYEWPVFTPEHVWGQPHGAIAFGSEGARRYTPDGRLDWEMDFKKVDVRLSVGGHEVAANEQIRGAPVLVLFRRQLPALVRVAIDADGNMAAIIDGVLHSLTPDLSLKWSLPLGDTPIPGIVVGPMETLLVADRSQLRAIE